MMIRGLASFGRRMVVQIFSFMRWVDLIEPSSERRRHPRSLQKRSEGFWFVAPDTSLILPFSDSLPLQTSILQQTRLRQGDLVFFDIALGSRGRLRAVNVTTAVPQQVRNSHASSCGNHLSKTLIMKSRPLCEHLFRHELLI